MALEYYFHTLRWLFCVYVGYIYQVGWETKYPSYATNLHSVNKNVMKSEKPIAFDNNNVASFRNKMGYFQAMPLREIT